MESAALVLGGASQESAALVVGGGSHGVCCTGAGWRFTWSSLHWCWVELHTESTALVPDGVGSHRGFCAGAGWRFTPSLLHWCWVLGGGSHRACYTREGVGLWFELYLLWISERSRDIPVFLHQRCWGSLAHWGKSKGRGTVA